MAVSNIIQYADEYIVQNLASFNRNGTMYAVWSAQIQQAGYRSIFWRPYTSGDFTEVQGQLSAAFANISALWRQSNDTIIIAHDIDDGVPGSSSSVYISVFNPTTGALISGPTLACNGFRPRLMYRGGVVGDKILLVYGSRTRNAAYLRESDNGGATWSNERPIVSNVISGPTAGVHAVAFNDEHMSLLLLGQDSRPLSEIGSISHTRPWMSLVKHPSVSDEWFVAEPAQNAGAGLADFLRGGLVLESGGTTLFNADGTRQGTSDSIGSVALISTTGTSFSVLGSITPTPSVAGQDIVALSLTPAVGFVTNVLSSGPVLASISASAAFVYGAAYSDTPGSDGALIVYQISNQAFASIASVTNGHAVGVGVPPSGTTIICFGTTESGQEKLRIYLENGLSPTLQNTHKMPARINSINVVMTSATQGTIYVSMIDRFDIYVLNGLTSPIRLELSIPVLSRGQFFQSAISPTGNIVAAIGKGGVAVFDTNGRTIAQTILSGIGVQPWLPNTVYALNALVAPTLASFYSPQRTYFKCSTGGTSGLTEPGWMPSGNTVIDNSAQWQEVGDFESVVTGVGIDQTRNRIYAVGVVGGNTGLAGRFYALSAIGLL